MLLTRLQSDRGPWSHHTSRSRCQLSSWRSRPSWAWASSAFDSGSASWSRWRVCAAGTCAAGTGDTAPHGTPSGTWQHITLILGTAKISRLTIMYHPTRGDTTFATSIFYSHFNKSLSSTICFKRRPIRCFNFQQIRKSSFVVLKVAPLGGRARWKICNWHI